MDYSKTNKAELIEEIEALKEISQNRGVLYNPKVVDACLKLFVEKGFRLEQERWRKTVDGRGDEP